MDAADADYILSLRPEDEHCRNCENLVWYSHPNGYIKYWTCFVIDSCQYMKYKQKKER